MRSLSLQLQVLERVVIPVALGCALVSPALAAPAANAEALRGLLVGSPLDSVYAAHDYSAFWRQDDAVGSLLRGVEGSVNEGLDPEDYNLAEIRRLLDPQVAQSKESRAQLDVLLTSAFHKLVHDLRFGHAEGSSLLPDLDLPRSQVSMPQMAAPMTADLVVTQLQQASPNHFLYGRLLWALSMYRALAANGGWPSVPEGETLRENDVDPRVRDLRKRLVVTGDLATPDTSSMWFDTALLEAVKRFQARHDLSPDGAVGPKTLAALNVPVEDRVNQIRVNLERARWILPNIPDTFLAVNVAGFKVFFVQDGEQVWEARAQVGRAARETPIFKADMTHVVLNPTWTVPPTILEEDYFPSIMTDSTFLATKGLSVLDSKGQPVSPDSVAWGNYTGKNFPYMLRQSPGDRNALGRIKFMFPNKHFVFLHDTPDKSLFNRATRMYSSGCIRVERPFELAELVLNDPEKWSEEKVLNAVKKNTTRTVYLKDPLPVYVLYWTADVTMEGTVQFHQDIYLRDPGVLAVLENRPMPAGAANGD